MTGLEKYLGLPWKNGGRDATSGLDCWGLLRHVYQSEFNIMLPDYAAQLGELAQPDHVERGELESHAWFEVDGALTGDAVALGRSSGFSHVGIYAEIPDPALLHITALRRSNIVTIKDMQRQGFSLFKFYRHVDRFLN